MDRCYCHVESRDTHELSHVNGARDIHCNKLFYDMIGDSSVNILIDTLLGIKTLTIFSYLLLYVVVRQLTVSESHLFSQRFDQCSR